MGCCWMRGSNGVATVVVIYILAVVSVVAGHRTAERSKSSRRVVDRTRIRLVCRWRTVVVGGRPRRGPGDGQRRRRDGRRLRRRRKLRRSAYAHGAVLLTNLLLLLVFQQQQQQQHYCTAATTVLLL